MTPVVLIGLMVASALILAITWIEPRLLGGPAAPKPAGAGAAKEPGAPEARRRERAIGPVKHEERPARVEPSTRQVA